MVSGRCEAYDFRMVDHGSVSGDSPLSRFLLTPRETEVLRGTSQGRTNAQIAAEIGTTIHAVKFHLGSIFKKLGVSNRTEAAMVYFRTVPAEDRGDLTSDRSTWI